MIRKASTAPDSRPEIPPEALSPRLLLVYHYVLNPPFTPRFREPGISMFLIVDGQLRYFLPTGKEGTARRGDLVTYYSGIGGYEVAGGAPVTKYAVAFTPALPPLECGVPVLPDIGRLPEVLNVGAHLEKFVAVYERLIQAMSEKRPTWPIATASGILQLIQMVFDLMTADRIKSPAGGSRLDQVLLRLQQSPQSAPSIRALAAECGSSVKKFIQDFARRSGKTPKRFLLDQRLYKARQMLLDGGSVKNTAFSMGFNNPLYFSRLYRQRFGYPPSQTPPNEGRLLPDPGSNPNAQRLLFAPGISYQNFRI